MLMHLKWLLTGPDKKKIKINPALIRPVTANALNAVKALMFCIHFIRAVNAALSAPQCYCIS